MTTMCLILRNKWLKMIKPLAIMPDTFIKAVAILTPDCATFHKFDS